MFFIYRFTTNNISIDSDSISEPKSLDGVEIEFSLDDDSCLKEILFKVNGIRITYTDDNAIITDIPSVKNRVYKVCCYLVNRALLQTSSNLGDPSNILLSSPEVYPETDAEEEIFREIPRKKIQSFRLSWNITKRWNLTGYENGYEKSIIYSTFSDALRVNDEFLQYQQLYKVIEHCFSGSGEKLDKKVSEFLLQYDSYFTEDIVRGLRDVRRRLVHPDSKGGHINKEVYGSYIREIREKYKVLHRACCILLENGSLK